jgi:hypothetical protein
LEGNSASTIQTVECHRIFAIGTENLIRATQLNLSPDELQENAQESLVPGVYFSSAPAGEEDEAQPTEGAAAPVDLQIGSEFGCSDLIVFRFEINQGGEQAFRVDVEVFPETETR